MLKRSLAFCIIFLAGCGKVLHATGPPMEWPMYQGGLTHNAVLLARLPAVQWTIDVHSKVNGGFGYDGTRLYFVDFAHELVAVDPRTGNREWIAMGDDVLMSTPIVAGGLVFIGSGTNTILKYTGNEFWGRRAGNHWYAFRAADGALVWSYRTAGEAMPSAAYANGRLIFATGGNTATALDARTGKVIWKTKIPGVATMGSVMIDRGTAFVVTTKGKDQKPRDHTLALSVRTGRVKWIAPYGDADGTPTVADGLVYVEDVYDGPFGPTEAIGTNAVRALDEKTGTLRWSYLGGEGEFTAVGSNERGIAGTYANGVLYESVPSQNDLIAFAARTGHVLWKRPMRGPIKMSPLVYRGSVYVGDSAGVLYKLDARTGAVRSAWPYAKPFTTAPPLIVGGTLFIADTDQIHAIPLNKI